LPAEPLDELLPLQPRRLLLGRQQPAQRASLSVRLLGAPLSGPRNAQQCQQTMVSPTIYIQRNPRHRLKNKDEGRASQRNRVCNLHLAEHSMPGPPRATSSDGAIAAFWN
jgi:hypothetical protein